MQNKSKCYHCGEMTKVKVREISLQSWEILFLLGEVARSEINMPICDTCFSELREVMIERRDEVQKLEQEQKSQRAAS